MTGERDDRPGQRRSPDVSEFITRREEGEIDGGGSERDAAGRGDQHRGGTDERDGEGSDRTVDDGDELPDEVVDLLEEDDDELDSDPRAQTFGQYAGVAVVPVVILALFVGPWRLFDFSLSAGVFPFVIREADVASLSLIMPIPVLVLVGVVAGATYRATTPEIADGHRSDMVAEMIAVQLILAIVAYLLLLLVVSGYGALTDSVVLGGIVFVAGIVGLVFFSFFELLTLGIAVGVLAYVGVLVGDGVGILVRKADT